MENIKTTLTNITEGLTATNEAEILPVYFDGELANGVTYAAYRLKRFAQVAGRFTTEAVSNTAQAAIRAAELTDQYLTYLASVNN